MPRRQPHRGISGNKTLDGSNEQPTADTIYGIGSVTKIFPVLQLFMLFERGVVRSLDDPVSAYMPGFQVINPFEGEQPTLFQLATQLSGLPREAPCPGPLMGCYNATNADMVKRLSQTLLTRAPNEYPSYSNLAYALLGRTQHSQRTLRAETFEMWVSKNILAPLGMDSTGFHYLTPKARGHRLLDRSRPSNDQGWCRANRMAGSGGAPADR